MVEYTTDEGWTLRVSSTLYLDWALEVIDPEGESRFYNPCYLSHEDYGVHWPDEGDGEGTPWSEEEWRECLSELSYELLEACVGVEYA